MDIEVIIVWLLRWTGLRGGEATSLLVRDVEALIPPMLRSRVEMLADPSLLYS
jgi:hypothetical protein